MFFYVCVCPSQVCSKLSPELSELVVYCSSVPFRGFENASEKPPNEMSSFSESEALRLIKDSGTTMGIIASWQHRGKSPIDFLTLLYGVRISSFPSQESFLWDTTAGSWAGFTPPASASNHPTMILRQCGTAAVRWVSSPDQKLGCCSGGSTLRQFIWITLCHH